MYILLNRGLFKLFPQFNMRRNCRTYAIEKVYCIFGCITVYKIKNPLFYGEV